MTTDELIARAHGWMKQDPDPETRAELSALIDAVVAGSGNAAAELTNRFSTRLAFGTAGLRGQLAAGPNRMNRVLVAQAALGLAHYLLQRNSTPTVVIGYDGRKNSRIFAEDSAAICAGAGVRAILLPRLLPTPVLAFAVRHLNADAGVMVTASHNPAADNGYKVYLGGANHGAQIVPPADVEIAACIQDAAAGSIADAPRAEYQIASEALWDAYIAETAKIASADTATLPTWVYTAMHGVGWDTMRTVLNTAGVAEPVLVTEQIEPDPSFPTVAFPNPEEPGAMDLSFAKARDVGAELVIANDPDADRLAVAILSDDEAGYRRLSGNEVGTLLGWRAAEIAASRSGDDGAEGTLACSIVSSPALAAIASRYGLDFTDTLTGFKWISRAPGLIYGFEEALGYLVNPETVRDKDGISAAVAFLDVAAGLAAEGRTIADRLDEFVETFGAFESAQISIRVTELSRISRIMAALRTTPPARIGSTPVTSIDDLRDGFEALPPSDVLRLWLDDLSRIMVRPSGTEPKLKVYIDAHCDIGTVAERRATATATIARLSQGIHDLLDSL